MEFCTCTSVWSYKWMYIIGWINDNSYFPGRANVLPQHSDRVVARQELQRDDPREVLGGARFQPHGGKEERPARRLSGAWVSTDHNMWSTHEKEIILVICAVWGNPTIRRPRGVFWPSLRKYLQLDGDNWKFTHVKSVIEPSSKHIVKTGWFILVQGFEAIQVYTGTQKNSCCHISSFCSA